jgi:hypothetical protein
MLLSTKNLLYTIKHVRKNSMKYRKNHMKIMKISRKHTTPLNKTDTILQKSSEIPSKNPGKYLEIQGTVIEYREPNEHNIRNRTSSGSVGERSIFEGANTMEQ